jgi:hypothetical protein
MHDMKFVVPASKNQDAVCPFLMDRIGSPANYSSSKYPNAINIFSTSSAICSLFPDPARITTWESFGPRNLERIESHCFKVIAGFD